MMMSKVECQICGKKLWFVNDIHLELHDITLDDYKKLFDGVPYISERYLKVLSGAGKIGGKVTQELHPETRENLNHDPKRLRKIAPLGGQAFKKFAKVHPELLREWGKKGYEIAIKKYPDLHTRAGKGSKGSKVSPEGKANMLKARLEFLKTEKGKEYLRSLSGTGNPNWRGGVSFEPYSAEFNAELKCSIKSRDNNRCVLCGSDGDRFGRLSVHHIDYDKNNSDERNLITLCLGCNAKVNSDKEYWYLYFRNIIKTIYGD